MNVTVADNLRMFAVPTAALRTDPASLRLFDVVGKKANLGSAWAFPFDEVTVAAVRRFSTIYIPAPIEHAYDWPTPSSSFKPMSHQVDTAQFLTTHRKAFNLGAIGTGKTFSTLWALDHLFRAGKVSRALILAPKSTVTHVWAREMFRTFGRRRKFQALIGSGAKRRLDLKRSNAEIVITNHDALRHMSDTLPNCEFDTVIVDESTTVKAYSRGRNKGLRAILKKHADPRVWFLSGGPMPQGPMDMYGQAKIICPERIPPTKLQFEEETMYRINKFMLKPRPHASEKVYSWIAPVSIRYSLEECVDMPEWTDQIVEVEQTDDQTRLSDDLRRQAEAEIKDMGRILAVNEGVYTSKLLQIAAGAVIYDHDEGGTEVAFVDCQPKLDALEDALDSTDAPVLLFCPWRGAIAMLEKWLEKNDISFAKVDGSVTQKGARDRAFDDVQNNRVRVLLANPEAMAHGITLTRSHLIVWWGLPWKAESYNQANGRIRRIGQEHKQVCIHLLSSPMERMVYERLKEGLALQGALLEMIRRSR